jgi:hypothetical protein
MMRSGRPMRVVVTVVGLLSMRVAVLGAALALVGSACSPEFNPASLIKNDRVIAIVAEPPESIPGGAVTLTPLVVSPKGTLTEGDDYQARWWRCPNGDSDALGDFTQCTIPDDRKDFAQGAPLTDTVPTDLFGNFSDVTNTDQAADALPTDKALGALLGYWRVVGFTMDAGKRVVDGFKRELVYLPFRLDTLDPRLGELDARINANGVLESNTNPTLSGVVVHEDKRRGAAVTKLKKGHTYFFQPIFDDRTLQEYFSLKVDFAGLDLSKPEKLREIPLEDLLQRFERVQRCEIPVFSWFVTAGAMQQETTLDEGVLERVFDPRGVPCPPVEGDERKPEAEYTAPTGKDDDPLPADDLLHAWVVMRDGRGGTATFAFDLPIE